MVTEILDNGLEDMDQERSEDISDKREMLLHYGNYQAYGDVCAISLPSRLFPSWCSYAGIF